jgi:hypothetical protein
MVFFVALIMGGSAYGYAGTGTISSEWTVWLALFGLAIVGVLALFFSSSKIKALSEQYAALREAQEEFTLRQNVVLGIIGERLSASTNGMRRHREVFEEQTSSSAMDMTLVRSELARFRRDEKLLNDALHDLTDFAQIRSGSLSLHVEPFDLGLMLAQVEQAILPHYQLHRNRFDCRYDRSSGTMIEGDKDRIEQIVSLISNEMGQGVHDADIRLSVQPVYADGVVRFEWTLAYVHRPSEILQNLFAGKSIITDTEYSNRKLKAYIAQGLIEQMGGRLTYGEDADGRRRYRLDLPLRILLRDASVDTLLAAS